MHLISYLFVIRV